MGTIFSISSDKNLLLYSSGSSICLRTSSGLEITRPLILCNDFSSSLSSAVYHDIIYFVYQNTEGDLIFRNVLDNTILFRLYAKDALHYFSPLLILQEEKLMLLFLVENPLSGEYILKYTFPLDTPNTTHNIDTFPTLPQIQWICPGASLLLVCNDYEKNYFYLKKEGIFQPIILKTTKELEIENHQKENKIEKIEQELAAISTMLTQKEQELFEKIKTIESAKQQYDNLMNTAYRYKEEAEKWYTKYYSRK